MRRFKIAILDMYNGSPNQGMRCIRELVNNFTENITEEVTWDEFEVRQSATLPGLDYDMYISSGGPGSPLDSAGSKWENDFFALITNLINYNSNPNNTQKKHVFFICHSYQLACRYFNVANVTKRKSTAFGIFPMHLTTQGLTDAAFVGMPNPVYAVDSRDYQVVAPNETEIAKLGATILAIEKERPHVPLERAIMGFRFNQYMVGTQFHPEADAVGMSMYFKMEEKKKAIIENHGLEKYESMITHLNDPDKILYTYSQVLPNFLQQLLKN
jgi:homoserine O-succinyltransferase/O-acetyltransferase